MKLITGIYPLNYNKTAYYLLVLLIAMASFLVYSPLYHPHFNSDHAIHVLMSYRYEYPIGLFYWGQNRLGSLLPEVSHVFVKHFGMHPLTAISIVNHLFLLGTYFILCIPIKNIFLKLTLCTFLFFPLFTYNALLLVGHPYCSQLFAGAMAIFFLYKLYSSLIKDESSLKQWRPWVYSFLGGFFLWVSIWVSEFSFVFGIFILLYIIVDFKLLKKLTDLFLKEKILCALFIIVNAVNLFIWYSKYKQYKSYFKPDELYDQVFLDDSEQIGMQYDWMKTKLISGLDFSGVNGDTTYSWFYWSLLLIFCMALFFYRSSNLKKPLHLALIGTVLAGSVMLFYSTWNFRSEFEPRYYTVIIVLVVTGLLYLSSSMLNGIKGWILASLWLVVVISILKNNSNVIFPIKESVEEKYGEFAKLPEGGMIGNYWWVHKINAVCPYNIKGITIQHDVRRNTHMTWEVMNMPIVYVIKNDFLDMSKPMPDTLYEYDMEMIKLEKGERKIGEVVFAAYSKYH